MTEPDKKESVLIVDDVADTVEVLERNLKSAGYTVYTAPGVAEALITLETIPIDLVVTDCKMPKISGLDLVRHIRENCQDMEVIMITGYPSVSGAVQAVKSGAEEYLAKPFTDNELFAAVRRALDKLQRRRLGSKAGLSALSGAAGGLIGQSEPMLKVLKAVSKVAATSASVLITGESGTGKELVARAIQYSSHRATAPFVPINCGGIPETLLESELFGYVKGAFTGATESRAGFFQTADGGTIFLDEISETSLNMQVKLLRVLQEQEVYLIGSTRKRNIDVRVLASTNKDLPRLVEKGLFREDLYYRLNVVTIELPPLRSRGDDIVLLVNHFRQKYAQELGREPPQFTDEALNVLKNGYAWPGNVRELENIVHRLMVMSDTDRIDVFDLPAPMRFSIGRQTDLTRTLAQVEAEYIESVLASVGGNQTKAAAILGVDRKTLRQKSKKSKEPDTE
jgi:two-component system, NtrC family, response regulator HydG